MNRLFLYKTVPALILSIVVILLSAAHSVRAEETGEHDEPAAKLGIVALGTERSYFTLTLAAGESQEVEFEVHNRGSLDGEANIYLANIGTLINGGINPAASDETLGSVTLWADLSDEVLTIPAGERIVRSFMVTVPEDAQPGEYATSLVMQEAQEDSVLSQGGIGINTVTRRAIAVAITVPGPAQPELAINSVEHRASVDRSIIAFAVESTGNMRLKPKGEFTIADSDGVELARAPVEYRTIYTGTSTTLEVSINSLLLPGDYTVSLSLIDPRHEGFTAESGPLTMTVPEPEEALPTEQKPTGIDIEQTPGAGVIDASIGSLPGWLLVVIISASVLLGALAATGILISAHRRRLTPPNNSSLPPVSGASRPGTVKRLVPPTRPRGHGTPADDETT